MISPFRLAYTARGYSPNRIKGMKGNYVNKMAGTNTEITLRSRIVNSYFIALLPILLFTALGVEAFLVPSIKDNARETLTNSTRVLTNTISAATRVTIENHLETIAKKNFEIARYHLSLVEKGELSHEEAVKRIEGIFLSQQVGSSGYIYCINSLGDVVVHPNNQLLGANVSEYDFVQQQIAKKTGYIEYSWKNPGEAETRPKALYMQYFEPLDWIISVSSYREEFHELIDPDDFRHTVLSIKFGKTGYAYVLNTNGDVLIHPKFSDFNIITDSDSSADFAREMISKNSGYLEYQWKNPEDRHERGKLAVYLHIPELDWVIVSSSYQDEVYRSVSVARTIIYLTMLLLFTAVAITGYLLSGRITKPIEQMMQRLDKNIIDGTHERLPIVGYDELGKLALIFNQYFAKLESQRVALHDSELKYRQLIESANDAIFITQDRYMVFANKKTSSITGYDYEQLLSIPFDKFIHTDDRKMVVSRHIKRLMGDKSIPTTYSFRIIDRAKEVRFVQLNTVIIEWDGKPATLNFIRDITDQKKIEEALNQAQKIEAIGTLAGGIAHDFNNLLMGIQGRVSLMEINTMDNKPNGEHLAAIAQYVESAAALTQQLLGAARGGKYNPKPTDLNQLVEQSATMFGRTKKEITIELDLYPSPVMAEVEKQQIEQVLLNLYVNGWHAMEEAGTLTIRTAVVHNSKAGSTYMEDHVVYDFAVITVTDTGIGMDEETLNQIFDPFFTTKEKDRGTGLGLASAYGIIKNHDGFIDVESSVGKGTTFSIYLPFSDRPHEVESIMESDIATGTGKILLVDDEEMIIEVGEAILEHLGYQVLTASGGDEAIDQVKTHGNSITLIILDMIMPGMDGHKTYRAIKEILPEVRVILSSGYALNEQAEETMRMGCNGFIQKPFTLAQLSKVISEVLNDQA